MDKQEIIKLLKELKSQRGILGKIEWSIGIPKNNLSGYISGSKEIPKKFIKPLSDYLEKGEYIHKTIELPRDFIGFDKVGIIRADGTIEELKNYEELPESYQIAWKAIKSITQYLPIGNLIECAAEGDIIISEDAQKSHINNDEHNENIKKLIEGIRSERIPKERDTTIGRKIWEKEQENRISELRLQIKSPI